MSFTRAAVESQASQENPEHTVGIVLEFLVDF